MSTDLSFLSAMKCGLTELHLPWLVHYPWEALNCQIRTERSFSLNVTSPNVIYTTHWETDKTFKAFFSIPITSGENSQL